MSEVILRQRGEDPTWAAPINLLAMGASGDFVLDGMEETGDALIETSHSDVAAYVPLDGAPPRIADRDHDDGYGSGDDDGHRGIPGKHPQHRDDERRQNERDS